MHATHLNGTKRRQDGFLKYSLLQSQRFFYARNQVFFKKRQHVKNHSFSNLLKSHVKLFKNFRFYLKSQNYHLDASEAGMCYKAKQSTI